MAAALSAERTRVKAAQERLIAAREHAEKVRTARWRSWAFVAQAEDAVRDAERTLRAAREGEQRAVVANLMGDTISPTFTVAEATAALEEVRRQHAAAERARDAFPAQDEAAQRAVAAAESDLRTKIGAVVRAEALPHLLVEYEAVRNRLATLLRILERMPGLTSQEQVHVIAVVTPDVDAAAIASWQAALSALEADPAGLLPDGLGDVEEPAAKAA